MNFTESIKQWLREHKSSTLPQWLTRNAHVKEWILEQTIQYQVKNVMERVYIVIHGYPELCEYGNARQFNTYDKGYRAGCVLGNKCKCVGAIRLKNQSVTLFERYGVTAVKDVPGISDRRKQTNIEKFGVEYPAQAASVKLKHTESVSKRTPEYSADILNRTRESNIAKFGADHHMKNSDQVAKVRQTNIARYSVVSPLQNPDIMAKYLSTIADRSPEEYAAIVKRRESTMMDRYGVVGGSQVSISLETMRILKDSSIFAEYITGKTREAVSAELKISEYTLVNYAKKYQSSDLFLRPPLSKFETEVGDFIRSIGVIPQTSDRTVIAPKELDIYIPEKNIAIECCGLYWHSEVSTGRNREYHYTKFVKCREQGITLITLFEDEWRAKTAIVKQRLAHLLGATTNKVFARKCKIVECTPSEATVFIDAHHLQGATPAKVNLALEYKGSIVAVMTLGTPRYNKEYQYEILRFCTSSSVVGAASKLFKYFVKTYEPTGVLSYSDNRWGSGGVYSAMNFTKSRETVGYYYTDYNKRYNRTKFQKHKLVAEGADASCTEWEIMQQRGYDRIWDCGQSLWVYN